MRRTVFVATYIFISSWLSYEKFNHKEEKIMKRLLVCLMAVLLLAACQMGDEKDDPNDAGDMNNTDTPAKDEAGKPEDAEENASDGMQNNQYEMLTDQALEEEVKAELEGVGDVYLMRMGKTVYVAADIDETTFDMDKKEQLITDIIKQSEPDVETVRVTTNPDFLDLAKRYQSDVEAGKPVEGFFDEIGEMIDRVFPD